MKSIIMQYFLKFKINTRQKKTKICDEQNIILNKGKVPRTGIRES